MKVGIYGMFGAPSVIRYEHRVLGKMLYMNCNQDYCKIWNRHNKNTVKINGHRYT